MTNNSNPRNSLRALILQRPSSALALFWEQYERVVQLEQDEFEILGEEAA